MHTQKFRNVDSVHWMLIAREDTGTPERGRKKVYSSGYFSLDRFFTNTIPPLLLGPPFWLDSTQIRVGPVRFFVTMDTIEALELSIRPHYWCSGLHLSLTFEQIPMIFVCSINPRNWYLTVTLEIFMLIFIECSTCSSRQDAIVLHFAKRCAKEIGEQISQIWIQSIKKSSLMIKQ